jgi:phytoene dehydrogenase-like protein
MTGKTDAIIIGSGPNGLAAAIFLQQKGLSTMIIEEDALPGGSCRTKELTLPGFRHDIGSSIHPLAYASPFFSTIPLSDHGLEWIHPDIPFVHPMDHDRALAAFTDLRRTGQQFGIDEKPYLKIFERLTQDWDRIQTDVLGPLSWPSDLKSMLYFTRLGFPSARKFIHSNFKEDLVKTFFYGAAAHSSLPLDNLATTAFGLVLLILAHKKGWPFPKGGAGQITSALMGYYQSLGGEMQLNHKVRDLRELPLADAYLLDLTPRQILSLKGTRFNKFYRKRLANYSYGAGVFKVDWALSDMVPFRNELCRKAGTLHLGYSWKEIEESEKGVHNGKNSENPYIILAQHSLFDPSRAPAGKHTAWAYCHVPYGDLEDRSVFIEDQIEKAAPGFRDIILHRSCHNTQALESFNPNLVGGDINGGKQDITQLFTRPVARWSPYTTPDQRVYICSSSTPPGGGVHGMCGYHAARKVFFDHFNRIQ